MLELGADRGLFGSRRLRRGRGRRRWALAVAVLALSASALALAQDDGAAQTGLHYFAVENRTSGRVEQRGIAGSNGVAFSGLLLAPQTSYRLWVLQAETLRVGWIDVTTPESGAQVSLPPIVLRAPSSHDTDGDGLHDQGEFIVGSDPFNPDTDGDGILDGAEVRQGTSPVDGLPVRTGVIASADTPGQAQDVCATDDVVIVADGAAGISVFNVYNRLDPRVIARVNTVGDARRISCSGSRVAVADGPGGLTVIDISDPPSAFTAFVLSPLLLGGHAEAVAAVDQVVFVGTSTGQVVVVDLRSGAVLDRVHLGGRVRDLAVAGDHLFALEDRRLSSLALDAPEGLRVLGAASSPVFTTPATRLFVGGGFAYAVQGKGVNTFDVSQPAQPVLLEARNTTEFGWKHLVLNGSGLALAAVSPNLAFDGPHHVTLYDAQDQVRPADDFVATFPTAGVARAVAIYNGLLYVADHLAGLQVVNYLAYDAQGVPPTISLTTGVGPDGIEEGKLARVSALVDDDVQVRNVEFYVDGQKVATDGNYPFELHFTTPRADEGKDSVTVRARASDTGGNATWSEPLVLALLPDGTPPQVRRVVPRDGALLSGAATLAAFTNEPLDPASLTVASFVLTEAGPDALFDTPDDVLVPGGAISFSSELQGAFRSFEPALPPGRYRVTLTTEVTDLRGNPLATEQTWAFQVYSLLDDRDGDGIPDALELAMGLDPDNPDSNGNGIPDGEEDHDGDGLSNAAEVLLGRDPLNPDSNGNGIPDGEEDLDGDGLPDGVELALGTDPFNWDTDGDGFGDGEEVLHGSNPLDPLSTPLRFGYSPFAVLNRAGLRQALGLAGAANPGGLRRAGAMAAVANEGGLTEAAETASVRNDAPPDAVAGRSEGRPVSVENQGTPPDPAAP